MLSFSRHTPFMYKKDFRLLTDPFPLEKLANIIIPGGK